MKTLAFFLLCLLLLSFPAYWLRMAMTQKPPAIHDPSLIVEVPVKKDGQWKLMPPRASELQDKRRAPGALTPNTLRQIEIETARELFSGKGRDPMERIK